MDTFTQGAVADALLVERARLLTALADRLVARRLAIVYLDPICELLHAIWPDVLPTEVETSGGERVLNPLTPGVAGCGCLDCHQARTERYQEARDYPSVWLDWYGRD